MASNNQDDNERIALWVVSLVIAILLLSITSFVLIKQRHRAAAPAAAPVAAMADAELYDAPLSGELLATVQFGFAEATVPVEAAPDLARAMEALMAAPARKIVIAGFHDASGDAVKNADLAKQRAIATRSVLTAAGVDAARILLRKPESTLADGTAEEARRVEIRLLD
ncbi:OmpA family protein [Roseateles oligotrophus]|uniref:OmpA family protein n=1 Tax=Roseateles oligotrophus TaxID=1769250 RepID=A0ABT2YHK0_9BURK|nr:OmpA family protein [Roseateles oligotrophus]MCV2369466.1 OmpA family protein [Roseateles oligotrophus]